MSVQHTWHYMFSSNECTIYLTLYVWFKWVYNILDNVYLVQMSAQYAWECICLIQMRVQYSWHYMFSSNECAIYLTLYV